MNSSSRFFFMTLLSLVIVCSLTAQTGTQPTVKALPEPYGLEEFPPWTYSLRRFEIVSLGAFPILLFYSRIAMDLARFAGNGFDSTYAPWPFRNEYSYKPDNDEQWMAVKLALGLSIGVGALDYFLLSRRKARQQQPIETAYPKSPRP